MTEGRIIFKEQSYRIIGACFEVYKEKGNGFLETVYHECLALELERFVNRAFSRVSRLS